MTEKPISDTEMIELAHDDAAHLFEVFERFMDQGNRPVETMLLAFDEWSKVELLATESRLRKVGLDDLQIKAFTEALVSDLNRRLKARADLKAKEA